MKKTLIWILAVVITLGSAYYQRKTGPTYPKKVSIQLANNQLDFKLLRSNNSGEDCIIEIPVSDDLVSGKISYKRFPLNEEYTSVDLILETDKLIGYLPSQPPAGKLEYFITIYENEKSFNSEHVVIRFKGAVPDWALIPHIILMFIAMLMSNTAGLFAAWNLKQHIKYGNMALLMLLLGGMVFGPIVQQFAFGQAWTGIPFGWDLTDNKTLFAVIFWFIAFWANRKNPKPRYTIIASIVLFLIYIIPHSMFGSELDYSSGEVITGFIKTIIF